MSNNGSEQPPFEGQYHHATLVGHRIAVDTILRELIVDLYSQIEGGAERYEELIQRVQTEMHAIQTGAVGTVDGEWVKQQALHSIETFAMRLPNDIRRKRGEPDRRPS